MKNGKKRQSPSVERQLALSLVAVLETIERGVSSGDDELDVAATDARAILKTHGYENLESIPTRVKRIEAEIAEAVKAQDGAKLAQLGAALDRAKSGKPPLTTEKKPRAPRKPKAEKPPIAEKKSRKNKDKGTGNLILHGDGKLESLTEGEEHWLTRHPEPKG